MNIQELISILENEYEVYQDMRDLALKKKDILIEGNVNELDNIVSAEQACIAAISKLENKREQWLKDNSISGMEDIQVLLENSNEKEKLTELQDRFRQLLQEVTEINEHNQALIEQALEYVEFSINLIGDALTFNDATYEKKGMDKKSSSIFDEKI